MINDNWPLFYIKRVINSYILEDSTEYDLKLGSI